MRQKFFNDKFIAALGRSYLIPCQFWNKDDEEFYAKHILPPFKRFMKDLLPRLKKVDSRVIDDFNQIQISCKNRNSYILPSGEIIEVGAIITPKKLERGQPVMGMVFGFTPKKIILAGGYFGLNSEETETIRHATEDGKNRLNLLYDNEEFTESFGTDGFCRAKNGMTKGRCVLILNENFAGVAGEIPARFITDEILPEIIIAHYKGIKVVNRFLTKALKHVSSIHKITV